MFLKAIRYCTCNKLECTAAFLSVAGGFCSPLVNPTYRLIGFSIWTMGNILWMLFAVKHNKWGMWGMQFTFSLQNMVGILNMTLWSV